MAAGSACVLVMQQTAPRARIYEGHSNHHPRQSVCMGVLLAVRLYPAA